METTTKPKPFVFVMMPFDKEFTDIYQLGIKTAANDAGGYCERVDEQIFEERILDRIYNQIDKADVVVADLTGKNPNVFYETGYAHALGKRVILLTQKIDDIPFDLRHHFHIVYDGSIMTLKEGLTKRLKWYFDNPKEVVQQHSQQIEFYLQQQRIQENANISIRKNHSGYTTVVLEVYNASSSMFHGNMKFGIATEGLLGLEGDQFKRLSFRGKDQKRMYVSLETIEEIFPGDFAKYVFRFTYESILTKISDSVTLRLFTVLGYSDINFTIEALEGK